MDEPLHRGRHPNISLIKLLTMSNHARGTLASGREKEGLVYMSSSAVNDTLALAITLIHFSNSSFMRTARSADVAIQHFVVSQGFAACKQSFVHPHVYEPARYLDYPQVQPVHCEFLRTWLFGFSPIIVVGVLISFAYAWNNIANIMITEILFRSHIDMVFLSIVSLQDETTRAWYACSTRMRDSWRQRMTLACLNYVLPFFTSLMNFSSIRVDKSESLSVAPNEGLLILWRDCSYFPDLTLLFVVLEFCIVSDRTPLSVSPCGTPWKWFTVIIL